MSYAHIVAPYIADLDASGAAFAQKLTPVSHTITGIEYLYAANVPLANDLFAAFDVSDADISEGWAAVEVNLDETKFVGALAGHMAAAKGGKLGTADILSSNVGGSAFPGKPAGKDELLQDTVHDEIKDEINAALNANSVIEYMEANDVSLFVLDVDWSGAAKNMYDGLDADLRRQMFLQIGNRPINGNADASPINRTFSQILRTGDQLAFVFDMNASVKVDEVTMNTTAAGVDATGNGPASATNPAATAGTAPNLQVQGYWDNVTPSGPSTTMQSTNRRIGFIFTVVA
jgi:hypothetical protein